MSATANDVMFIIIMWPGVFRACEPGDEEGEPDLHEQHEEPGHEQPREVDRHSKVTGLARELVDADLAGRAPNRPRRGRSGGGDVVGSLPRLGAAASPPLPEYAAPTTINTTNVSRTIAKNFLPLDTATPSVPRRAAGWASQT